MTTVPPAGHAAAPAVSVIIPAYNAARTLPLQLEALAAQVDPPAFEVIVVDNGGTVRKTVCEGPA